MPSLPHTSRPLTVQPIYEPDVPRPRRQQRGVVPSATNELNAAEEAQKLQLLQHWDR
jgi:hypothetical protein